MKLLFDENLSPKLVAALADEFPDSAQVADIGLRGADDRQIWDHAREFEYVIVSKDGDFRDRSLVDGGPPKIIWVDVGNARTSEISDLLSREIDRIVLFWQQADASLLILSMDRQSV